MKTITTQEVALKPTVYCKLAMPNEVKLSLLPGHGMLSSVDLLSLLVQKVQMSQVVRCPWKDSGNEDLNCRVSEPMFDVRS